MGDAIVMAGECQDSFKRIQALFEIFNQSANGSEFLKCGFGVLAGACYSAESISFLCEDIPETVAKANLYAQLNSRECRGITFDADLIVEIIGQAFAAHNAYTDYFARYGKSSEACQVWKTLWQPIWEISWRELKHQAAPTCSFLPEP